MIDPTLSRPAACSLEADALGERLDWIRREILPHAVASEKLADGVAWTLRDLPGLEATLDRLVRLERACCAGLAFTHGPDGHPGYRRLEVRGIDPDARVFASLQAVARREPVGGGRASEPAIGTRLVRALGVGTAVGLLLCCALPVAAAAILGAAGASLLAPLESPWVVAASALGFAAATLAWRGVPRRGPGAPRSRADAGDGCGPGC